MGGIPPGPSRLVLHLSPAHAEVDLERCADIVAGSLRDSAQP